MVTAGKTTGPCRDIDVFILTGQLKYCFTKYEHWTMYIEVLIRTIVNQRILQQTNVPDWVSTTQNRRSDSVTRIRVRALRGGHISSKIPKSILFGESP